MVLSYEPLARESNMDLEEYQQEQFQTTLEDFDSQVLEAVKTNMISELLLMAVVEAEKPELTENEYETGLEHYMETADLESKEAFLEAYSESMVRK